MLILNAGQQRARWRPSRAFLLHSAEVLGLTIFGVDFGSDDWGRCNSVITVIGGITSVFGSEDMERGVAVVWRAICVFRPYDFGLELLLTFGRIYYRVFVPSPGFWSTTR